MLLHTGMYKYQVSIRLWYVSKLRMTEIMMDHDDGNDDRNNDDAMVTIDRDYDDDDGNGDGEEEEEEEEKKEDSDESDEND